ncbi:hypothetical protein WR25_01815 [Diploscapter pachys]|uniref:Uncharacterized protein n=1 Tax=Diploscapter pachys TaxID=2018661 RepID=A0A2A2M498_9BILA|nr:hypothetical protein WR25_01815 [Diploscapter pachys]
MALQHAGEAVAHLRGRRPDRYDAGHVGGAVGILPARIDQEQLAGQDRSVRVFGDVIMRAGAMRAGGRDGVERRVEQAAGLSAKGEQLRRSG